MENLCEICGVYCCGEVCDDCAYRMASGDSSDIRDRVAKFDNTEYEKDWVREEICRMYNVNSHELFDKNRRSHDYAKARHLFVYLLSRRFKMKQCIIAKQCRIQASKVIEICNRYDCKLKSNIAVNKYLYLLRY